MPEDHEGRTDTWCQWCHESSEEHLEPADIPTGIDTTECGSSGCHSYWPLFHLNIAETDCEICHDTSVSGHSVTDKVIPSSHGADLTGCADCHASAWPSLRDSPVQSIPVVHVDRIAWLIAPVRPPPSERTPNARSGMQSNCLSRLTIMIFCGLGLYPSVLRLGLHALPLS